MKNADALTGWCSMVLYVWRRPSSGAAHKEVGAPPERTLGYACEITTHYVLVPCCGGLVV
jgi:hypothetical protein